MCCKYIKCILLIILILVCAYVFLGLSGTDKQYFICPIEYQSDTTGNTVIGGDSGVLVYYFCTHCTPSSAAFIPVIGMFLPLLIGWKIFRRHEKTGEQQ